MISASEAFASIERAIGTVRRDQDRILALIQETSAESERLRAEQGEAFRALARLKLDALARDEVVGTLDAAERRAVEHLERRRGALGALAERRKALGSRLGEAEEDLVARVRAREEAVAAIETLEERTEEALAGDTDWQAADIAERTARAQAAEAERKAVQAEEDREVKRKPYEADPLFMYLWARGYGTSAYSAGPLTRYFDGKVAALIAYEAARPNYFMLNEIPVRLREHAARLAAEAEAAAERRDAVERAAVEKAGIGALEARLATVDKDVAEADARIERLKADLEALDREATGLTDPAADPAMATALDELASALSREDLRTLFREAQATPTPDDEVIVQKLLDVERGLVRVAAQMEELRKTSTELATRRTELERSGDGFRKRGYDDPFGGFINEAVIGGILEGIIRGALSGRALDEALGDGFRKRKPRSDRGSLGERSGLPGGGFRTGGGIKSSGGFRTGGTDRSSGGFRTGGGF